MPIADATKANPNVRAILEPGARDAIQRAAVTANGLAVALSTNVRGRMVHATFEKGVWRTTAVALPENGRIVMQGNDPDARMVFATYEGFLQPTSLYAIDFKNTPKQIMQLPAKFNSNEHVVEQFEATSRDGTRVPYFVVKKK